MRTTRWPGLLLALVAFTAGCGDDATATTVPGTDATTTTAGSAATTTTTTPTTTAGAEVPGKRNPPVANS